MVKIIGNKSRGSDLIHYMYWIKHEQLYQLNTSQSIALDQILDPAGNAIRLNDIAANIVDESMDADVKRAKLHLEILSEKSPTYPNYIGVYILKTPAAQTFTEGVVAGATTDVAAFADRVDGPHAFERLGWKKMNSPVLYNLSTGVVSIVGRKVNITVDLTKWLREVLHPKGENFYPNANQDEYTVIILRCGKDVAGAEHYVQGYYDIHLTQKARKAMSSI